MKKISFLFVSLISLMSITFVPVRTVSANTTITTADDEGFVTNTGGAITITLGTVTSGFKCTVANHGTATLIFSSGITVANGTTITALSKNSSEISPNQIGNTIEIWYDGTTWRGKF